MSCVHGDFYYYIYDIIKSFTHLYPAPLYKHFCRFVRPSQMSEQRINEYIEGKYGKFGVDRYVLKLYSGVSLCLLSSFDVEVCKIYFVVP